MRVLIGIAAALSVALGIAGWQLKLAWQESSRLAKERDEAKAEARMMSARFDALDRAVGQLNEANRKNAVRLDSTLAAVRGIQKTEKDDEQTMECLDRPVPRQLDDSLRQQDGGAADTRQPDR